MDYKVEYVPVGDLKPYAKNAKKHPKEQVERIKESIEKFGFRQNLVIDDDGVVVIGHGRLLAAKELGIDKVPCIRVSDLTEEEVNALRLADNKVAESEWDFDLLDESLAEIGEIDMGKFGFDLLGDEEEETNVIEDSVPEEAEGRCKPGDLWQLGNHRLICGDSTDPLVVDRLLDSVKADMVFTDPPYNIASDSKNFASDVSKAMKNLSESEWDKNFDVREVLDNILVSIAPNATVYVCTSHFLAPDIWTWMKEWADHYSYCVWSKPNPMPSLSKRHWTWNTELICYATRGKHTFNFPKEGHALSTWTINKKNGDTGHPTEKPVEVPAMAISHSSKKDDVVLDLFGGSGSTLIACEQLGRKCYMAELDPKYCDVIIQRYVDLKGSDADVNLVEGSG